MAEQSTNHGLNIPEYRETQWHTLLNFNWNILDTRVPFAGDLVDRPDAGEAGRKYFAEDEQEVYLDTGDSWISMGKAPGQITESELGFSVVSQSALDDHTTDETNPHSVTTAQIGAATATEFDGHTSDTANPHSVTHSQANAIEDAVAAVAESHLDFDPATQTELDSHTADAGGHHERYADSEAVAAVEAITTALAVDISGDAATVDGKNAADFASASHETDETNPHSVTAAQVSAIADAASEVTESHLAFDPATQAELDSHTGATNPHSLTYSDTGAVQDADGTVDEAHLSFDPATQDEFDLHSLSQTNPHDVDAGQAGALPADGGTLTGDVLLDKNAAQISLGDTADDYGPHGVNFGSNGNNPLSLLYRTGPENLNVERDDGTVLFRVPWDNTRPEANGKTLAYENDVAIHEEKTSNPHSVDYSQTGAIPDKLGAVSEGHLNFDPTAGIVDYTNGGYMGGQLALDNKHANYLRYNGVNADMIHTLEDTTGRYSMYWNSEAGGDSVIDGGENGARWQMHPPNQADSLFSIGWFDGSNKSSGDGIAWDPVLSIGTDFFTWQGEAVLNTGSTGEITPGLLSFDPTTQSEFDTHAGETNPHGLTPTALGAVDVTGDVMEGDLELGDFLLKTVGGATFGNNPSETIQETTSPMGWSFSVDDGRDVLDQIDVTITTTASLSMATIDVTLYEGTDNTGTQVATDSVMVSLDSGVTRTYSFLTSDRKLDKSNYYIEVGKPTDSTVDSSTAFTIGGEYTLTENMVGDLDLNGHAGRTLSVDSITNAVNFGTTPNVNGDDVSLSSELSAHAGSANPHGTTASDVSAVPDTGGSVTGDIDMNENRMAFTNSVAGGNFYIGSSSINDDGAGVVAKPENNNPAMGDALFRVLSLGGKERLRVEHNGVVSTQNSTIEANGNEVWHDGNTTSRIVEDDLSFGVVSQTDLDNHTGDTANPHDVTATQSGALPAAGGTLTGDLTVDKSNGIAKIGGDGSYGGPHGIKFGRDTDFAVDGLRLLYRTGPEELTVENDANDALFTVPLDGSKPSVMGDPVTLDSEFTGHAGDEANPHAVTASQVGAASESDLTNHTADQTNPHSVTSDQTGAIADSSGSVTRDHSNATTVPLSLTHSELAAGLSNEEVFRLSLAAGETLQVDRLETKLKGGGTLSGLTVDVYDETNATVVASTSDVDSTGGTSGDGASVIVRVSNSTGSEQIASISGSMYVV